MQYRQGSERFSVRTRQQGFSLVAAFIVIAILMAVVAYFVAGSGMNTSSTGTYSLSARASSLVSEGGYMQGGANLMITQGQTNIQSMTFDTAANTGLFNPTTGGSLPQTPDATSFVDSTGTNGAWLYRLIALPQVGVVANGDYVVITTGVKQGVCEQLNSQLHGTAIGTPAPASTKSLSAWVGGATKSSPSKAASGDVLDLSASNADQGLGYDGWDKGCIATSDGVFVYFHVISPQ